ncbi:MFS transporter [Desertibaculum subflavum]|uniref:MFS transporter n=1 Tax=Desertibaculum subflavum TaxID=2268458 RepID=UPI000E6716AD
MNPLAIAVIAMLVQQAFSYMAGLIMPVSAPVVARELGLNPALVGAFTGITFAAGACSQLACGPFIQRHGPLRISQVCLATMAAGLLLITSGALGLIAVAAIMIGLSAAPATPASSQILARLSPPHLAPLLFSIKQTGVPVGAMLAGAIVPLAVAWLGWRGGFIVGAAICLALAAALQPLRAGFDKERDPTARFSGHAVLETLREVLRTSELRVLAITAFAFVGLQSVFASFFVIYLTGPLGHDLATAGLAFSVAQGIAIPARIFWGWIGSRIAPRFVLAGLGIGMILSSIVLGLTGAAWSLTAVILVGCAYTATAVSWHGVLLSEVARLAPRERISNTTGGVLSFGSAGMALFPLGFGAILGATGTYSWGFFLAALPATIATGLLLRPPRAP